MNIDNNDFVVRLLLNQYLRATILNRILMDYNEKYISWYQLVYFIYELKNKPYNLLWSRLLTFLKLLKTSILLMVFFNYEMPNHINSYEVLSCYSWKKYTHKIVVKTFWREIIEISLKISTNLLFCKIDRVKNHCRLI
jgi:hypothetical protein